MFPELLPLAVPATADIRPDGCHKRVNERRIHTLIAYVLREWKFAFDCCFTTVVKGYTHYICHASGNTEVSVTLHPVCLYVLFHCRTIAIFFSVLFFKLQHF